MNWRANSLICFLFYLCLVPSTVAAEEEGLKPKNFMLSDYVFERPQSWLWIPMEGNSEGQKLRVPAKDGGEPGSGLMLFYPGETEADALKTVELWKQQFEPRTFFQTNHVILSEHQIIYIKVGGTQRGSKTRKERRAHFALIGAVIVGKQGKITARIVGPQEVVDSAAKDFKQMIENALKKE